MTDVAQALGRALANLVHPKMFFLMIWPIALSIVLWTALAILFGSQVLAGVQGTLSGFSIYQQFSANPPWAMITTGLLWILGFLLFVPLVLITATIIIGVFSMPMMVRHVADRQYPQLARKQGGGVAGSTVNVLSAFLRLLGLLLVSLPLWLLPILWPVIPIVLFGYFNQRMFRYDALAEHATADELKRIITRTKPKLWLLGGILAVIGHIPILGFFMPVLGGLAFIYFLLEHLALERQAVHGAVARGG
jgi:CysZ protein